MVRIPRHNPFLQTLYARRAPVYDLELLPLAPLRREAIAALQLRPGQTVLDLGCGTGLSLPGLAEAVGPQGRIVAVEPCPEMLERARQRVPASGRTHWPRVDFIATPAEDAPLDQLLTAHSADAALFFFTHDLLQQPAALRHAMQALKPGAKVVAAGLVWAAPWWPLSNLMVMAAALHSIASPAHLDAPWHDLAPRLSHWTLERRCLEAVYLLRGQR